MFALWVIVQIAESYLEIDDVDSKVKIYNWINMARVGLGLSFLMLLAVGNLNLNLMRRSRKNKSGKKYGNPL